MQLTMIIPADIDMFNNVIYLFYQVLYNHYTITISNRITFMPREVLNMIQLISINFTIISDNYSEKSALFNHNLIRWENLVNLKYVIGISKALYKHIQIMEDRYIKILKI